MTKKTFKENFDAEMEAGESRGEVDRCGVRPARDGTLQTVWQLTEKGERLRREQELGIPKYVIEVKSSVVLFNNAPTKNPDGFYWILSDRAFYDQTTRFPFENSMGFMHGPFETSAAAFADAVAASNADAEVVIADNIEQMQEANPVPDDYAGRRLYVLEMLVEMAAHYKIPIPANEIEKHVKLEFERLPDGTWDQGYHSLTDAGAALMMAYEEEAQRRHLAEAEARKLITRPWTWKLPSSRQ